MGENESDLLKLASAATYAIRTNPWRFEVILRRSFVDVNMGFLLDLDDKWLIWCL
jgi:hypothetical protein